MSNTVIHIEHLSKRYRIGARRERYVALRDQIMQALTAPLRRLRNPDGDGGQESTIWALKDVSFDVKQGEVVGIIGPNGAGKSTLLKVLSRITEPTEGRVRLKGRVGSLLEVGTGFNPELTGRDNVYLNGAILGMRKVEIDRKFDEIVEFAGIEKFIETPIKHYSSGMYMRLAFAVAAHLEPEILLVDEVLAVGDAQFQKKCLGKMSEVARHGRTILFVSHNMHAIRHLCSRVVYLSNGTWVQDGPPQEVVQNYLNSGHDSSSASVERNAAEYADKSAYFSEWKLAGPKAAEYTVSPTQPVSIALTLRVKQPVRDIYLGLAVWSEDATLVWTAGSNDRGRPLLDLARGTYEAVFSLDALPLRPGTYSIEASVNGSASQLDRWHALPQLTLAHADTSALPARWRGLLELNYEFALKEPASPGPITPGSDA